MFCGMTVAGRLQKPRGVPSIEGALITATSDTAAQNHKARPPTARQKERRAFGRTGIIFDAGCFDSRGKAESRCRIRSLLLQRFKLQGSFESPRKRPGQRQLAKVPPNRCLDALGGQLLNRGL